MHCRGSARATQLPEPRWGVDKMTLHEGSHVSYGKAIPAAAVAVGIYVVGPWVWPLIRPLSFLLLPAALVFTVGCVRAVAHSRARTGMACG